MPELPEVETTVRGLQKTILDLTIKEIWTDLNTKDKRQIGNIANPRFFLYFKKEVLNKKILSVERRAKNILINLNNNKTILVHMKMTGHLLFNNKDKFVHVLFYLSKNNFLAFSDARKFGKITLIDTDTAHDSTHLKHLGPEPLDKNFNEDKFKKALEKKPNGKIKTILMDQSIIAGIGNIYSDEILWRIGMHPEKKVSKIKPSEFKVMFKALIEILAKGIDFGGDSMSDYINLFGEKGKFQNCHKAYRRTGEKCEKKNCKGIIQRKIVNGRSAHFCSIHQK